MSLQSPTLFDLQDWTQIRITGPDRASHLHNFCTNNINALQPGQVCEAFIPDIKGRILAHIWTIAESETLHLISLPGTRSVIIDHLQKYLLGIDAEIADVSDDFGILLMSGATPAAAAEEITKLAANQNDKLDGHSSGVKRCEISWGDEKLFAVYGPQPEINQLKPQLLAQSLAAGSDNEFERLRICSGIPKTGVDIGDSNIAQEAARTEQTVSFTKGCYLGQEPIARLDAMGHTNKELRGLLIESSNVKVGDAVLAEELEIGKVTSVAAYDSNRSVALTCLKMKFAKPGGSVTVVTNDSVSPATIFWPTLTEN